MLRFGECWSKRKKSRPDIIQRGREGNVGRPWCVCFGLLCLHTHTHALPFPTANDLPYCLSFSFSSANNAFTHAILLFQAPSFASSSKRPCLPTVHSAGDDRICAAKIWVCGVRFAFAAHGPLPTITVHFADHSPTPTYHSLISRFYLPSSHYQVCCRSHSILGLFPPSTPEARVPSRRRRRFSLAVARPTRPNTLFTNPKSKAKRRTSQSLQAHILAFSTRSTLISGGKTRRCVLRCASAPGLIQHSPQLSQQPWIHHSTGPTTHNNRLLR